MEYKMKKARPRIEIIVETKFWFITIFRLYYGVKAACDDILRESA